MKHLLGIGFIIVFLRITSLWTPIIDVDESQFAGFASVLLNGGLPYVDSLDTKPLGIYWFFASIFWLFGENNMVAVHLVTMLVVAATAFFCFRIASAIGSPRAGVWAALFYAIFPTCFIPKIISTSIVIIMMLPLTMSIDALIRWRKSGRTGFLFASGFLWGIACLFKYQAGINLLVVGSFLLYLHSRNRFPQTGLASFFRYFALFLLGGALVGCGFLLYLFSQGIWDEFVFWSLKGSVSYIRAARATSHFWHNMFVRGGLFLSGSWLPLWLLLKRSRNIFSRDDAEILICLWFLFSLIPVCVGGRFYGHYFLQLMPAICIIAAFEAENILPKLRNILLAGLLATPLFCLGTRLFQHELYVALGEENPESYRPIGERIRTHSTPEDRIFVWGFATPIYFFADRLPASRFLWCDWMTGRIAGSPSSKNNFFDTASFVTKGSWTYLFQDLERHKPLYFVDTSPGNYHGYGKYPASKYPALEEYLHKHYTFESDVSGAHLYRRNNT